MTKRAMARLAQWCSRVFMVEIDQSTEPFYFSLSSNPKSDNNTDLHRLFTSEDLYSLYTLSDDRIHNVRTHALLKHTLTTNLPPDCHLLETASFIPNANNSLIKGFLLRGDSATSYAERILNQPLHNLFVLKFNRDVKGEYVCSNVSDVTTKESGGRYYVTPVLAPEHHPSTLNIINSDVFYQMEDAYKVLQECTDVIPESKAVLKLVDEQLELCSSNDEKFPVIVIEGLDATGKTTLTCSLQKELGAVLLKSPPQCLAPYRESFDAEPPLIRRAFYALGNYITAGQIMRESLHAPVIVDRYWHSTAAYAVANAVSGKVQNLPPVDSEIYNWPSDLLRPNLVLLLSVSPQERLRRLLHRGLNKTEEEKQLEINHLFRNKVDEAYRRIQNPACLVVDASPSPESVLQQVLRIIKDKCHIKTHIR